MSEALLQSLVVVQKQTNYSAAALGIQNELHSILKLSKYAKVVRPRRRAIVPSVDFEFSRQST